MKVLDAPFIYTSCKYLIDKEKKSQAGFIKKSKKNYAVSCGNKKPRRDKRSGAAVL
jgi:hypothetical protein